MIVKLSDQISVKIEKAIEKAIPEITWEELHCKDSDGRCTHLDATAFAKAYITASTCECYDGILYTPDGVLKDNKAFSEIIQDLAEKLGYKNGIPAKAKEILQLVKSLSFKDGRLEPDINILPFRNGELDISDLNSWVFYENRKAMRPYRFPVDFPLKPALCPKWKGFLSSLLNKEDIDTVKVFLGYCLIPTTESQGVLILQGAAGTGKSQIWPIVHEIWGESYYPIHIHRLSDRFALSGIESRLILGDDDMAQQWMQETDIFKSMVGGEALITIERKGIDSYPYKPYARIIGLTNHQFQALHDDTPGFVRRIIPITIDSTPKPTGKSYGKEIISEELNGIIIDLLEGLKYWQRERKIPLSDRTKENRRRLIEERDSLHQFAYQALEKAKNESITTQELFDAYTDYCIKNDLPRIKGAVTVDGFGRNISNLLCSLGYTPKKVPVRVDKTGAWVDKRVDKPARKSGWAGCRLVKN